MEQFEEKIKKRLESYESGLPEDGYAGFREKLESAGNPSAGRRKTPLLWIVPAAAAALALVLLLGNHHKKETPVNAAEAVAIAEVATVAEEMVQTVEERTQTVDANISPVAAYNSPTAAAPCRAEADNHPDFAEEDVAERPEHQRDEPEGDPSKSDRRSVTLIDTLLHSTPTINDSQRISDITIRVIPAAAGVIGSGVAIAAANINPSSKIETFSLGIQNFVNNYQSTKSDTRITIGQTCEIKHRLPVQTGFSIRIPINDRISISSGAEYSWYSSSCEYVGLKTVSQNVSYLGVPLRADFDLIGSRLVSVYAGAGVIADFCIAANIDGEGVTRDIPLISLLGAVGVQLDITKHIGVFLEPRLSWAIPSERRILETYRTEHPVMISLASGLRFTINR